MLLGQLITKSKLLSRWVGRLLIFAGIGYVIDSFAFLYFPSYQDYEEVFALSVILPAVIGELCFSMALLRKGFIKEEESLRVFRA